MEARGKSSSSSTTSESYPREQRQALLERPADISTIMDPRGRPVQGGDRGTSRMKTMDDRKSSGNGGCVEKLHYTLITLLWLVGVAIVVLGAVLVSDMRMGRLKDLKNFAPLHSSAILVIVIGAAIIIIGVFGCIGVKSRSRLITIVFMIFMVILIVLEIAACILTWYYKKGRTLEVRLNSLMARALGQYFDGRAVYEERDEDWNFNRNMLSFIERTFYCCGSNGPSDYSLRLIAPPNTCYYNDYYGNPRANEQGCVDALQNFMLKYGLLIGLFCVAAMILQLALIATSLMLAKKSSEDDSFDSLPKSKPSRQPLAPQKSYDPQQELQV